MNASPENHVAGSSEASFGDVRLENFDGDDTFESKARLLSTDSGIFEDMVDTYTSEEDEEVKLITGNIEKKERRGFKVIKTDRHDILVDEHLNKNMVGETMMHA